MATFKRLFNRAYRLMACLALITQIVIAFSALKTLL